MKKIYKKRFKYPSPLRIPFSGWKTIIWKIKDQIAENNVTIVSAGVGFYGFLAIFPAIMALVSIYGLVVDPRQIEDQLEQLSRMMPEQAYDILEQQVQNFISISGEALGLGTAIGILLSIWSANKGTKSLFTGIDIAYNTRSTRGFIRQNLLSLSFTFGAIILVLLSMVIIVMFPALVGVIGLPERLEDLISWLRWIILAILLVIFLSLVYRYAPQRRPKPKIRWMIPGAFLATLLWLIASLGFSFYIKNFGNYGEVYGSISAVVVLLLWLLLTSLIILIGAQINAELEKFATPGAEKPLR